jgi:peptidyl-tRNA hydrolase, PTH1 family
MKLIVGLGNPGADYEKTRHNVGFRLIDYLAEQWGVATSRRKFDARYGQGERHGRTVALLKPQTFMNHSGDSVSAAMAFYRLGLEDMLVALDDMALPPGQVRLRAGGTSGGHNGLQDIIDRLGRNDFPRLRIGIGPAGGDAARYVLDRFEASEEPIMEAAIRQAADAAECWLMEGIDKSMTKYNVKRDTEN